MSNGAWKQKSKGQEVVLNNYKKMVPVEGKMDNAAKIQ